MSEIPDELVERCERAACEAAAGDHGVVRAVLSESGHAELVAALIETKPFIWVRAELAGDALAKGVVARIDEALRKAGAL